jgi:hypothetical protein
MCIICIQLFLPIDISILIIYLIAKVGESGVLLVSRKIKVLLVVFGNGMSGKGTVKMKGHRSGSSGVIWRALKRREATGDFLTVVIDEFCTTQVCCSCQTCTLRSVHIAGNGILRCETCKILWNRDVNAAKNMMQICLSMWNEEGGPQAFTRGKAITPSTISNIAI